MLETFTQRLTKGVDSIVTMRLTTLLFAIEERNNPVDVPFYNSLSETLSFMLSEEDLEALATREMSTEWLETAANATQETAADV